jgi:hypothetical protein
LAKLEKRFLEVHEQYIAGEGKKKREFRNWCNLTLKEQAKECGKDMQRLYAVAYRQLSAYVHGSAWALRRQDAYIRASYDPTVIMVDFAHLTRILLAVWIEWAKIMSEELGWQVLQRTPDIIHRCNKLDEATMERVAEMRRRRSEEGDAELRTVIENKIPRCILCNGQAGEDSKSFSLSPEADELLKREMPGVDYKAFLSQNPICAKCQALPRADRQRLVQKAILRELELYRESIKNKKK